MATGATYRSTAKLSESFIRLFDILNCRCFKDRVQAKCALASLFWPTL